MEDKRNYADKAAASYYDRPSPPGTGGSIAPGRTIEAGRLGDITQRLLQANTRLAQAVKRTHGIANGLVGAPPIDHDQANKVRPARMGGLGTIEDAADGTSILLDALEGILSRFEEGLRQG